MIKSKKPEEILFKKGTHGFRQSAKMPLMTVIKNHPVRRKRRFHLVRLPHKTTRKFCQADGHEQ
jgi:hypothetical protein